MSEAKYTKGPWVSVPRKYHIEISTTYDCFDGEDNIGPETICVIGGLPTICVDGGAEWEATGNLIAAAPDMYDALEEVWRILDSTMPLSRDNRADRIKRILCKARGEEE